MPRQRRRFCQGEVYHITNRTKSGLPFVPNRFIRSLIEGVIAQALYLYAGVDLIAFNFMGNHYHMVVALKGSAEELSNFAGYFQGELSSIIHRLTGVSHDNLWAGRYHYQALLDAEAVFEKIAYTFLNPVAAGLVDKVDSWEGANSWEQFQTGETKECKWFTDARMQRLPRAEFTHEQLDSLCEDLEKAKRPERTLRLEQYSWAKYFPETKHYTEAQVRETVLAKVAEEEKRIAAERTKAGKKVAGAKKLRYQSIYRYYKSKEYGRTPLALSTCLETLRAFKERYRVFCDICRKVWYNWRFGDGSLRFPPGAFIPTRYPLASIWGET